VATLAQQARINVAPRPTGEAPELRRRRIRRGADNASKIQVEEGFKSDVAGRMEVPRGEWERTHHLP